jgi:hypothetical protein
MLAEIPQRVLHGVFLAAVIFVIPLAVWYFYLAFLHGLRVACRITVRVLAFEAVVLGGLFVFFAIIPTSQRDNAARVLQLFLLVLFLGLFIPHLIKRTKGGSVLLYIGRNSYRAAFCTILAGILIFFVLRSVISEARQDGLDLKEFARTFGFLSIAALGLFFGFSKIQIREDGILYFLVLIKWEKIDSYQWEGRNASTLTLKYNRPKFFLFQEVNIAIPPYYRDYVDNLLFQIIPAKNRTSEDSTRNQTKCAKDS